MVEVNLWSALRQYADGAGTVEVEAKNVGEMLKALARDYPGMADILDDGVTVSVDGEMSVDDHTVKLTDDSEVFLMQRMKGG